MQKTLQFLNAVNGACHSSKTANMILSRKPPNGWDARGAITRQFSILSLVVVWCNIILQGPLCLGHPMATMTVTECQSNAWTYFGSPKYHLVSMSHLNNSI